MMASVVYTYTGNDFTSVTAPYATSDFISGSLTLELALAPDLSFSPITPLSYTFTDGIQSYSSDAPPPEFSFDVGTDANGNIDQWYFLLGTGAPDNSFISTGTSADNDSLDNGAASGQNADDAGTWSSNLPSVTPEPGSLTMVACALMAIGAVRRRSQRRSRT